MTTPMQQYSDLIEQSQEAARTAVEIWTRTVQGAAGRVFELAPRFDPEAVVDQYFDISERLLNAQRSVAKGLVLTGLAAASTARI